MKNLKGEMKKGGGKNFFLRDFTLGKLYLSFFSFFFYYSRTRHGEQFTSSRMNSKGVFSPPLFLHRRRSGEDVDLQ